MSRPVRLLGALFCSLIIAAGCAPAAQVTPSTGPSATTAAPPATAGASAAPSASGEITVLTMPGQLTDEINAAIPKFQAIHPDVKVTLNTMEVDAYNNTILQVLGSADTPDVSYVGLNAVLYPRMLEGGLLLDVSDVWDQMGLEDVLPPSTVDLYTSADGKRYSVNTGVVWTPVVWYNKAAFAKAGVTAPDDKAVASMDEWYRMTDALRVAGYEPLALGGATAYPLGHLFDHLLPTSVSHATFNEFLTNWQAGSTSTAKYTDPEVVRALQTIADWNGRKVFAEGTAGIDDAQARALYVAGKAAMLQDGSWGIASIKTDGAPFDTGWFLYPAVDPANPTKLGLYAGDGYGISAKSDNPVAAKAFLSYLISAEHQSKTTPSVGLIPARTDLDPSTLAGVDPLNQEQLGLISKEGGVTLWDSTVPAEFGTPLNGWLQSILTGAETPESVAAKLQEVLETLQKG
jgi:raffinose/stachyose/melibiose transport system substrate-binding protein